MSWKTVRWFLLALLVGAGFLLFIIFWRVDPYKLSERELLFFLLWIFLFLFPLFSFVSALIHRQFLRRPKMVWTVLRQGAFAGLFFTTTLALQIFGAFSIVGVGLLALAFLLLEIYFQS
ncbi:hypothetical protein J7L13_03755 [bacterium]|nr:hypothetical protein [bacterium]